MLRADTPGTDYAVVGVTTAPVIVDSGVSAGASYLYAVVAQDTSFNRSTPSEPLSVTAAKREVAVTFTVTVPKGTPATATVYIAGDFQGWNPASTPMTKVDDLTWTITLPFVDGAAPQYKYTRGSWEAVEKDAGCGELPNRTLSAAFGASGEQAVSDGVEKWRDLDRCG